MPTRWKINIQKDWGEVGFGFRGVRIFVFEQKLARNTLFLSNQSKDITVWDSDQVSCLVPTVKKFQMFVRVKENFAFELIKNIQ